MLTNSSAHGSTLNARSDAERRQHPEGKGSFHWIGALLCLLLAQPCLAADASPGADGGARYPTRDEAFYVLSCMERNGRDAEGLRKCSCAINAIAEQLPYEQYSEAVLVFAMRQAGGERAAIYRDTDAMKEVADRFIRAQREANRQCFGSDSAAAIPNSR
jgi:hypothetical protein